METKHRLHGSIYLIMWAIPIILFISRLENSPIYNNVFHDVYTWIFISIVVLFAIISSTTYLAVSDKGLRLHSLLENKYINYDEIKCMVLLPPYKLIGISVRVGIFDKGKNIEVSNWIKGYKEILRRVIAEAEKREIKKIDREVVALLK